MGGHTPPMKQVIVVNEALGLPPGKMAAQVAHAAVGGLLNAPREQQAGWLQAFGVLTLGFVILTGYTSINAVVKAELFPTHVRALGVGLGYALANSALGGTAPLL